MAQNVSTFKQGPITFYFQSQRAGIDGKAALHLVDFIKGARRSLDVAIYDLKEKSVLDAFAQVADAGKVKLRQSTRMSHSVVGTSRLLSWRGLPKSIAWN